MSRLSAIGDNKVLVNQCISVSTADQVASGVTTANEFTRDFPNSRHDGVIGY